MLTGILPFEEDWYLNNGFEKIARAHRYRLSAQGGRVFFRSSAHPNEDPKQIEGWDMSIGRVTNARCHWERDWTQMWDVLVGQGQLRVDRFRLLLTGQEAMVCARQDSYHRQTVDITLWSKKPLSVQLMISLREWAFRQKYRELQILIREEYSALLDDNAEADGYFIDTFAMNLGGGGGT